ncbi:MAG: acyl carrier protein [Candidatus Competibacteraceae bacterium]|nr:acyl carrier protein [Candidatus Competibacteraceae bacterium]
MNADVFLSLIQDQFPSDVRDDIGFTTSLRSIKGWSSLQALVITVAIDETFNVLISDADLRQVNTVSDLYHLLLSKKQNHSDLS